MVTTLLVLSLLSQASQDSQLAPQQDSQYTQAQQDSQSSASDWQQPSSSSSANPPPPGPTRFRGALEATALSLPSGPPGGSMDVYAVGLPILAVEAGDIGFELGAELRLRVFDEPPLQTDRDYGHLLRRQDWDEISDFGQVLRRLRIGSDAGPVVIRAGRMELKTLGHGHLVSRYDNLINPDYHPASASATVAVGPVRTELFASDILAARLFAGEVSLDIGRLATDKEAQWDRYHFALSAAHDFGLAGGTTPPITLVHADADAALYKNEHARVFFNAGGGARLGEATPDFGAVAGFSASGDLTTKDGQPVTLGGRLEGRKQQGGFRQGMFGPAYELSRFSGIGFGQVPVANEKLPNFFSGYGEFEVGYGPVEVNPDDPTHTPQRLFASFAAEYFVQTGRLDGDAAISLRFPGNRGTLTARFTALDALGVTPRFQGSGELRYRFAPSLYVVAAGGTVFFPQPDSSLVRGAFGSLGLGADFER